MAYNDRTPAAAAGGAVPVDYDPFGRAFDRGVEFARYEALTKPDGAVVVFAGEKLRPVEFAPLNRPLPEYVTAAETVVEPDSFVDYIRNYKSETAICRASLGQNQIVAVLDYHGRAREGDRLDARPNHLAHTVTLKCPFDPDYLRWRKVFADADGLDQKALAEFIEDMVHTIGAPPAADLLEAITDLKIDRSVSFKSARNQRNGTIQFTYSEVDADRPADETVTLPEVLTIIVPVFQGGNPRQLEVRLRYRLNRGAVSFHLSVAGLENIERQAFRSIGERVRFETATPVYYTA